MKRVYILGAGASVDYYPKGRGWEPPQIKPDIIHVPLPTSNTFFHKAIEHGIVKETYCPDLWRFIHDKYGISFKDLKAGRVLNIENVYGDLDTMEKEHSGKNEDPLDKELMEIYQNKYDLLDLIHRLITKLCRGYGPCINHRVLAGEIISDMSDVISFNWDTLMDEALHNTGQWFYNDGYGTPFFRMYSDGMAFTENDKSKCHLLKPHGSVNWFRYGKFHWSDKDGFTAEEVSDKERAQTGFYTFSRHLTKETVGRYVQPVNQRLNLGQHYDPLLKMPCEIDIIPPAKKRRAFPSIWSIIKKVLGEAEEIIIIGFSFNSNDYHIKEEFEGFQFKKGLKVKLVNPAQGIELEKLQKEYGIFFGAGNVEKIGETFKEYCDFIAAG